MTPTAPIHHPVPTRNGAFDFPIHPFQPRRYLTDYFVEIDQEYEALYSFWCGALSDLPRAFATGARGLRALDLGAGPTLYSAICLAAVCSEIHLSDYVPDSLREIERWLAREAGCFDWSSHIELVLRTEGQQGSPAEVAAREEAVRRAITRLLSCDVRSPHPLGGPVEPYDIVTAHYCVERSPFQRRMEVREFLAYPQ